MRRVSMLLSLMAVLAVAVAVAVAAPRESAPRGGKAAQPTPAPAKDPASGPLKQVG